MICTSVAYEKFLCVYMKSCEVEDSTVNASASSSPTIVIFRRTVIRFIDGCSEALVAASSPNHVLTWAVKR